MRTITALFGCGCLVMSLGCAMCDSSQDCKYAAYGGAIERLDMVNGRVNSILNPASISRTEGGSQSQEVAPNELAPTPAAEQDESPSVDTPLENEAAEQRAGSSPLDELNKLPRSGNNIQEQLDNLNIPRGDSDTSITPNSDSDVSPSLEDLFDDIQDET